MNTSKAIKTMCALAGITVMAATANAFPLLSGAQIAIDRAINSPTLTVKYSGHRSDHKKFILELWTRPGIREVKQV